MEWERQLWHLALKAEKPLEAYREMLQSVVRSTQEQPSLDDLPKERLSWLRAT